MPVLIGDVKVRAVGLIGTDEVDFSDLDSAIQTVAGDLATATGDISDLQTAVDGLSAGKGPIFVSCTAAVGTASSTALVPASAIVRKIAVNWGAAYNPGKEIKIKVGAQTLVTYSALETAAVTAGAVDRIDLDYQVEGGAVVTIDGGLGAEADGSIEVLLDYGMAQV